MTYRECIRQAMLELGFTEPIPENFMKFMIQKGSFAAPFLDEECPDPERLKCRMQKVVEAVKKRQSNQ